MLKRIFRHLLQPTTENPPTEDVQLDFRASSVIADPTSTFEILRHQTDIVEVVGGGYALLRHRDVRHALSNRNLGNVPSKFSILRAQNALSSTAADFARNAVAFRDGTEHAEARRALAKAISTAPIPSPDILQDLAGQSLTRTQSGTAVDLIADIATPFVSDAMTRWFGIPSSDGPRLAAWSGLIMKLFAPIRSRDELAEIAHDIESFRQHLSSQIDSTAFSESGLLASLATSGMPRQELIDNAILIFIDGIDNVRYGIGNAALTLMGHDACSGAREALAETPFKAVQEALRLNTPATVIARVAVDDTEVCGRHLRRGTPVFLVLASANRDGNVFPDADTFDSERDFRPVLTFGHGNHGCLGGHVATAMITAVMQKLAETDVSVETSWNSTKFVPRFGHRWPTHVKVSLR